jgi:hypothetical protein
MKRILSILVVLLLVSPGVMFADIITFRLGYFFPTASSELWQIEFDNMTFTKTEFAGSTFGFAYEYFVTNNFSVQVVFDGYSKNKSGFYQDYVAYEFSDGTWAYPGDFEGDYVPGHAFKISVTPIQLSLKIAPLGRRGRLIPFIGGGIGVYVWSARLQGDLIDFDDVWWDEDFDVEVYPIYFADIRDDNKLAFGFHGLAGAMFPLANRISIEGEVKYNFAKGSLDRFVGFDKIDLSGLQISLGINYWF